MLGTINHGYTYGAHPVAAAAALATLEVLERENIPARAAREGRVFSRRACTPWRSASGLVGDVRGVGLMAGIELVADKRPVAPFPRGAPELTRVQREAYKRGAMIRLSGANIILSPALTIERAQIDLLCDALEGAFARRSEMSARPRQRRRRSLRHECSAASRARRCFRPAGPRAASTMTSTRELAEAQARVAAGSATPTLDIEAFRRELAALRFRRAAPAAGAARLVVAVLEHGDRRI